MTYHVIDFDTYPISPVFLFLFVFFFQPEEKKVRFLVYKILFYASVDVKWKKKTLLGSGFWLGDKRL